MKTAILVDGGFYRKMARKHFGEKDPSDRVQELVSYCKRHLKQVDNFVKDEAGNKQFLYSDLYRIFYYDCPPVDKNVYHPLTRKTINFKKESMYKWMNGFLDELKKKRKLALRLGFLARLEGIDFILDPMGHSITESLQEHIDGLRSYYSVFAQQNSQSEVIS